MSWEFTSKQILHVYIHSSFIHNCQNLEATTKPFSRWMDKLTIRSDQISSFAQSCLTLCNPMNRSTPGLPVHHKLPEFTQTHVHWVSDAIQPSHPLASPSPLAPIPPSIRVFSNESTLRMRWPKDWSFSFSIIPSKEIPGLISRMDWLDLLAVQGTLKSLLQHHISGISSAMWAFPASQCPGDEDREKRRNLCT